MKKLILLSSMMMLTACVGEGDAEFTQQKWPAAEPENHSAATANEITPAYAYSAFGASSGVYGDLQAAEEDYYYVEMDFFDSGTHQITLTDMDDNLDLSVTDWDGNEYISNASSTTDELVSGLSSRSVRFFGDEAVNSVRVLIKVSGSQPDSASRYTLTFTTFDD